MTAAQPFIEAFRSTAASVKDGSSVFASEAGSKLSDDARAAGYGSLVTAMDILGRTARRYGASVEARSLSAGDKLSVLPIAGSADLHSAVENAALQLAGCKHLGIMGARLAKTLRDWTATGSPDEARLIGVQAETAARLMRKRAGH